jgi:ligand-binding sensor domain-containing protein
MVGLAMAGRVEGRFVFHHIDTSDGLSDNTVKCITQDDRGFIWFGTFNGLCRFDGVDFSIFRHNPNDSFSLINNRISAILANENGIWAGTDGGLNFYSYKDNKFYSCERISAAGKKQKIDQSIKSITEIGDEIFVLLTDGNLYVKKQNLFFEECTFMPDTYCMSVAPYKDNFLLAHTRNGLYLLNIKNRRTVSKLLYESNEASHSIYYSRNRNTVYVAYGLGSATETFRVTAENRLERTDAPAPANAKLVNDYNDYTLFATDGKGLLCYNQGIITDYMPKNSNIQSDAIFSLFTDKDNNLWVGTYRGGVNIYSSQYERFLSLTVDKKQITHNIVTAVWVDENRIFAGLDGGGLNIYERKTGKSSFFTTQNSRIAGDNVLSLSKDETYLWLGIYNKGLCRFSLADNTFKTFALPPSEKTGYNTVWEIKDDGCGNIWTFGPNVYRFNKQTEKFTLINTDEGYFVSSMTFDGDALWIGSVRNGLYKLNREKGEVLAHYTKKSGPLSVINNVIRYVFVDSNQNLWFVADNAGLFAWTKSSKKSPLTALKTDLPTKM